MPIQCNIYYVYWDLNELTPSILYWQTSISQTFLFFFSSELDVYFFLIFWRLLISNKRVCICGNVLYRFEFHKLQFVESFYDKLWVPSRWGDPFIFHLAHLEAVNLKSIFLLTQLYRNNRNPDKRNLPNREREIWSFFDFPGWSYRS